MKWGFRLEVKSRLASWRCIRVASTTTMPPAARLVRAYQLLLRAVPGKQGSVRREGQSEPVFAMEESSVRRG